MSYIGKSKRGWCVFKSNGKKLRCLTGKDAKKRATENMNALNKKNKTKTSNRGDSARKRVAKAKKKK